MVKKFEGSTHRPFSIQLSEDYVAELEQKLSAMSQQLTDTVIENQKLRDLLEHYGLQYDQAAIEVMEAVKSKQALGVSDA